MNYRELKEKWSNFLLEQESSSMALFIKKDGDWIDFILYYPEILVGLTKKTSNIEEVVKSDAFISIMQIKELKGACGDSFMVNGVGVNKQYRGQRFGSLIYFLTMSYIYPKFLTADRVSVTAAAENIWKSLEKNPNVEKWPPKKDPYVGKFDNIKNPVTKPINDDCRIYSGRDALNKAYRANENKDQLNQLMSNNNEWKTKIDSKLWKNVFNEAAESLFNYFSEGEV